MRTYRGKLIAVEALPPKVQRAFDQEKFDSKRLSWTAKHLQSSIMFYSSLSNCRASILDGLRRAGRAMHDTRVLMSVLTWQNAFDLFLFDSTRNSLAATAVLVTHLNPA